MRSIKILLYIFFLLSFSTELFAQSSADGTFRIKQLTNKRSYSTRESLSPIRASAILNDLQPMKTKLGFQVFNFETGAYEYREGMFIKKGSFCKIFVEVPSSEILNNNIIEYVPEITENFDKIIYPLVSKWFGKPEIPKSLMLPDEDIYIFLTEIKGIFSEGYVAGYFDHRDLELGKGNRKPILFMDISKNNLSEKDIKTSAFYRTIVHELQHLVNHSIRKSRNIPEQERWLDEGYSMFAEYLYSGCVGNSNEKIPTFPHLEKFLLNPTIDLTCNSDNVWFKEPELYQQYGASFIFVAYLVEKYGGNSEALQQMFLKELVKSEYAGALGIDKMLNFLETDFNEILLNFNLAISLDEPVLNNGLWSFNNKNESFGEPSKLIPLNDLKIFKTNNIYVLPSTFANFVDKSIDYSSYFMQTVEIPVFPEHKLVILKAKTN